jgi:hypothetical protein
MKHATLARVVAAALAAIAASQAPAGPQEELSACGAIADPAERLACYDRVSGRSVTPAPAPAPSPAPSSAGPRPAASPAAPAAAGPASPAAGAPAQAAVPAAKPAAPPADARTFGSYPTEHPAASAVAKTLSAQVVALGKTIDGFPTVTLEGGALWLLDEKDPLLAIGDTVTLTRGVLGGFLLETPTRRLHHVRRIR